MKTSIEFLQDWYAAHCNDTWEHSYGIEIVNIDNPGWRVKINGATGKNNMQISFDKGEENWMKVNATETEFTAYGAPKNLSEILTLAELWLKKSTEKK